jgi:hypothetical protein
LIRASTITHHRRSSEVNQKTPSTDTDGEAASTSPQENSLGAAASIPSHEHAAELLYQRLTQIGPENTSPTLAGTFGDMTDAMKPDPKPLIAEHQLVFVRHGQSSGNDADVPCQPMEVQFCSPYERVAQTADMVARDLQSNEDPKPMSRRINLLTIDHQNDFIPSESLPLVSEVNPRYWQSLQHLQEQGLVTGPFRSRLPTDPPSLDDFRHATLLQPLEPSNKKPEE